MVGEGEGGSQLFHVFIIIVIIISYYNEYLNISCVVVDVFKLFVKVFLWVDGGG